MRFRRRRNCSPNSGWPTGQSSRWMLCIAKKTFEVAAEANTALIVQVKDNQPTLNQKIREIASTTAPIDAIGSRTKGRNRDERRTVTVFDPAEKLARTEWHPHVAAIACVERKVFTRIVSFCLEPATTETAFYVSNTTLTAVNAADAIRGHWKIETTSHYSRDVTFGEDKSVAVGNRVAPVPPRRSRRAAFPH